MRTATAQADLEGRWRARWREAAVFAVPPPAAGVRDMNVQVSCPFTSGAAHMGHVRSYSIADAYARYRRARGDAVLFTIGFDAFGLPAELGAIAAGVQPEQWVTEGALEMRRQFDRLGISFDWSRSFMSSDPAIYRWSQWLFLVLLEAGMVAHRQGTVDWCPSCQTVLAKSQVVDGECWRCHGPTEAVERMQWYLETAVYGDENRARLGSLNGWSEFALTVQRALVDEMDGRFPISRQRAWGAPIPIVHCAACGGVPVPFEQLPVTLPDDLRVDPDRNVLSRADDFLTCRCPACGGPARREADTLDCHFDATWQQYPQQVPAADRAEAMFDHPELARWLPVALYVHGADIGNIVLDERAVAKALRDLGRLELPEGEPYAGILMHGMVKLSGSKMSKHLGNAVGPQELVEQHGADALRVGILQAAAPARDVNWSPELATGAGRFLARLREHAAERLSFCAPLGSRPRIDRSTKRRRRLGRHCDVALDRVGAHMDALDVHRAVRETTGLFERIDDFANDPGAKGWNTPDEDDLAEAAALLLLTRLIAPFAPHIAEELWELAGCEPFVCQASWPTTI